MRSKLCCEINSYIFARVKSLIKLYPR